MEQLASEVLDEILVRVPLQGILQTVPLVCKKWKQSTRCPSFIRTYQLHHGKWLITGTDHGSSMLLCLFNIRCNSWYKLRLLEAGLEGPWERYFRFGAGPFIVLFCWFSTTCSVGNPLTNQWHRLSLRFPESSGPFLVPKNDNSNSLCDYYLMAIEYRGDGNGVQVYDFQTGSWTMKAVVPWSICPDTVNLASGFLYILEMLRDRRSFSGIRLGRYDVRSDDWKSMEVSAPEELDAGARRVFPAVVQCCGELLLVGRMNEKCRPPMRKRRFFSPHNVVAVWRLARPNWGQDRPGRDEWELISESPRELMEELVNHLVDDFLEFLMNKAAACGSSCL